MEIDLNRRKAVVNMSFKARYIALIVLPALFLAVFIIFVGFLTMTNTIISMIEEWNPASRQLEMSINHLVAIAQPEKMDVALKLGSDVKKVLAGQNTRMEEATTKPLGYGLAILIGTIVYVIITSYIGGRMINKVVGPVHRLNATAERLATKDFSARITLRDGDELMPTADALNNIAQSLVGFVQMGRSNVAEIQAGLTTANATLAKDNLEKPALQNSLQAVERSLSKLNEFLTSVKVPEK